MNRRKKINSTLKAKAKKANAKKAGSSKTGYVSKADRVKLTEAGVDPMMTESSVISNEAINEIESVNPAC